MISRVRNVLLPIVLSTILAGCGHCDGAFRNMRSQRAEWCVGAAGNCTPDPNAIEPVVIQKDDVFRMRGDYHARSAAADVLRDSGVSEKNWFLVDGHGKPVPAKIDADSGGHMCRNGVGFNLRPSKDLPRGDYTLVLLIDDLRWPYVENDATTTFENHRALKRSYRVAE